MLRALLRPSSSRFATSCLALVVCGLASGCSSENDVAPPPPPPPALPVAEAPVAVEEAGATDAGRPALAAPDEAGPAPTGCGRLETDDNGFFRRTTGKTSYVGYVPKSYAGKPTRLLVALHGCGDDAQNFAEWAAAPYATRDGQDHLAISVDGASAEGHCWNMAADGPKVLAAIDDVATCFYVHRKKVVVGGFSSGGMLAYRLALQNADRFAGVLVECSNIGGNPDALLGGAARKLPIAHRAHTGDAVFPISGVRATWARLERAGFPLQKSEVPGGHDGTSDDWAEWLIPQMATWRTP